MSKIFRTPVDKPIKKITPSGEKYEDIWKMKLDENGKEEFYVAGKTNIYEKIQAHKNETDIEQILKKAENTGDFTILNQKQGQFKDITDLPTNIFEVHKKIKVAEEIFNSLPIETRKEYNNNFNEFLADYGSEKFMNIFNPKEPKQPVEPQEPKKEEPVNE